MSPVSAVEGSLCHQSCQCPVCLCLWDVCSTLNPVRPGKGKWRLHAPAWAETLGPWALGWAPEVGEGEVLGQSNWRRELHCAPFSSINRQNPETWGDIYCCLLQFNHLMVLFFPLLQIQTCLCVNYHETTDIDIFQCMCSCVAAYATSPWSCLGNFSDTWALGLPCSPPGWTLKLKDCMWDLKQFVAESVSFHFSVMTTNFLPTCLPAANYFLPPPVHSEQWYLKPQIRAAY